MEAMLVGKKTKIKLRPQDLSNRTCEWEILQFPVTRLAYAMSITKSKAKPLQK
jgi:hypothetical protein